MYNTSIAVLITLFTVLVVSIVLLTMIEIAWWKIRKYTRYLKQTTISNHKLPTGSIVYKDIFTGNRCKRCSKGKILRRNRFKVRGSKNKDTVLHTLTGLYLCSGCDYRGLSLKE